MVTYLPAMLYDSGDSFWLAGASLSVLQLAGVVEAFFGGTLSDRFGRRLMIFAIFPASVLMFVFLATGGGCAFRCSSCWA